MIARAGHSNRAVFQGLENFSPIFPRLGKFRRFFSKAWKTAALLGAVSALGAEPPRSFTLESAVQGALTHNRELLRLAAAHEAALLERAAAAAEFAWRVRPDSGVSSVAGAQTRQAGLALLKKTEWGAGFEFGGRVISTAVENGEDSARRTLRASVSQPLFRYAGRETAREPIVRAESRILGALRRLELAKSDVALRAAEAYYDVFRLEAQARNEEAALERLERLRRLTDARARQGRASPVDALRVATQRGDAEARARAARERVAARRLDLADLLGLEPGVELDLAPPPWTDEEEISLEAALAAARTHRLDLAQVERDWEDARRGLRIARRGLRPDLRLVISAERYGEGGSPTGGGLDETAWSIGLQAEGDLVGGRERIAWQRAALDEALARDEIETARRFAEQQVRREFLRWAHARAEIGPALRNRELAEARLRLARRLFELGRGDSFAVTDAEQQFQQAEAAHLAARTEAVLAGLRLRRVMGTLLETPEELRPRGEEGP